MSKNKFKELYESLKESYDSLKEIGFVRVNRFSTVFVTTPKRLTDEFRNVLALKNYLLKDIPKSLKIYWKLYLNGLKNHYEKPVLNGDEKQFFKRKYNLYKNLPYNKILKFSIAIVRGKLDERN